jgi:hypothetical protein
MTSRRAMDGGVLGTKVDKGTGGETQMARDGNLNATGKFKRGVADGVVCREERVGGGGGGGHRKLPPFLYTVQQKLNQKSVYFVGTQ